MSSILGAIVGALIPIAIYVAHIHDVRARSKRAISEWVEEHPEP